MCPNCPFLLPYPSPLWLSILGRYETRLPFQLRTIKIPWNFYALQIICLCDLSSIHAAQLFHALRSLPCSIFAAMTACMRWQYPFYNKIAAADNTWAWSNCSPRLCLSRKSLICRSFFSKFRIFFCFSSGVSELKFVPDKNDISGKYTLTWHWSQYLQNSLFAAAAPLLPFLVFKASKCFSFYLPLCKWSAYKSATYHCYFLVHQAPCAGHQLKDHVRLMLLRATATLLLSKKKVRLPTLNSCLPRIKWLWKP